MVSQISWCEQVYGAAAVEMARRHGVFTESTATWDVKGTPLSVRESIEPVEIGNGPSNHSAHLPNLFCSEDQDVKYRAIPQTQWRIRSMLVMRWSGDQLLKAIPVIEGVILHAINSC